MKYIDLAAWPRRHIFRAFLPASHPHFSITVPMDVTALLDHAASRGVGVYSALLHAAARAANVTPAFRQRLLPDPNAPDNCNRVQVVEFDMAHPGFTAPLQGEHSERLFGFSFVEYVDDLAAFDLRCQQAPVRHPGDPEDFDAQRMDVLYCSVAPWFAFTSLTHTYGGRFDSVPRVTFGKMETHEGRQMVPVAVQCHHGLVDGAHVDEFLQSFASVGE